MSAGAIGVEQDSVVTAPWGDAFTLTGLATSMAVNALTTGMIVFRILQVFFKPTFVERTLGSLGSTEGSKIRHIIFIIIESGMTLQLFAIQLIRVVLSSMVAQAVNTAYTGPLPVAGMELVIGIHQIFNVIIISVHFYSSFVYEYHLPG